MRDGDGVSRDGRQNGAVGGIAVVVLGRGFEVLKAEGHADEPEIGVHGYECSK